MTYPAPDPELDPNRQPPSVNWADVLLGMVALLVMVVTFTLIVSCGIAAMV